MFSYFCYLGKFLLMFVFKFGCEIFVLFRVYVVVLFDVDIVFCEIIFNRRILKFSFKCEISFWLKGFFFILFFRLRVDKVRLESFYLL